MAKRGIPPILEVPVHGGGFIRAAVVEANGLCEVMLNDVPHIGLLQTVNMHSATIGVMTPDEANQFAAQLSIAAVTLARRLGGKTLPRQRRDVSQLSAPTRLHCDDLGSELFEVLDQAGQPMKDVHEVNCDEGWVLVLNLDEDGAPIMTGEGDDTRYTYVRVRGQYSIRRRSV